MASLVENAIRIKQTFDNILSAIKDKGASPSDEDDVSTYAPAILDIPSSTVSYAKVIKAVGYKGTFGSYAFDLDGRTSSYSNMKFTMGKEMDLFFIANSSYAAAINITPKYYVYINGVELPCIFQVYLSYNRRMAYFNCHVKVGDVVTLRSAFAKGSTSGNGWTYWEVVGEN